MEYQKNSLVTADEIAEEISKMIETLKYMPGDKLSENELCSKYGVSRHVVRNALATLKNRRLVEVFPQRGTFVSLIDMEYIADILFMRTAIEQKVVTHIVNMEDNEELIKNLKAAAANQRNLDVNTKNFMDKYYELDNDFHSLMLERVGRPKVINLIADPYIHVRRWRNFEVRSKERMDQILVEHDNIIDALESRDAEAARKCLEAHIDTVYRSDALRTEESQYFK